MIISFFNPDDRSCLRRQRDRENIFYCYLLSFSKGMRGEETQAGVTDIDCNTFAKHIRLKRIYHIFNRAGNIETLLFSLIEHLYPCCWNFAARENPLPSSYQISNYNFFVKCHGRLGSLIAP